MKSYLTTDGHGWTRMGKHFNAETRRTRRAQGAKLGEGAKMKPRITRTIQKYKGGNIQHSTFNTECEKARGAGRKARSSGVMEQWSDGAVE
jgi:hypothetical protein